MLVLEKCFEVRKRESLAKNVCLIRKGNLQRVPPRLLVPTATQLRESFLSLQAMMPQRPRFPEAEREAAFSKRIK